MIIPVPTAKQVFKAENQLVAIGGQAGDRVLKPIRVQSRGVAMKHVQALRSAVDGKEEPRSTIGIACGIVPIQEGKRVQVRKCVGEALPVRNDEESKCVVCLDPCN